MYDYCTSSSSLEYEKSLSVTATGRRKYLLNTCQTEKDRVAGAEIYYTIENYINNHVKKLHDVS